MVTSVVMLHISWNIDSRKSKANMYLISSSSILYYIVVQTVLTPDNYQRDLRYKQITEVQAYTVHSNYIIIYG